MNNEQLQAHVKSGEPFDRSHYPAYLRDMEPVIVRRPAGAIVCKDGFSVSIQASTTHYCSPRNNDGPYSHFELGFPSEPDSLITEYADDPEKLTQTVYSMVPLNVVLNLIHRHGGIDPTPTQE